MHVGTPVHIHVIGGGVEHAQRPGVEALGGQNEGDRGCVVSCPDM